MPVLGQPVTLRIFARQLAAPARRGLTTPLNMPKGAKSEPDGHLSDVCHLTSDLWPIGVISRVSRVALRLPA